VLRLLHAVVVVLAAPFRLLPGALLLAFVAVAPAAAPAPPAALASFALPAMPLAAATLRPARLLLRLLGRGRLLDVARRQIFARLAARLLRLRIGAPHIGTPFAVALLVGAAAPAVAVPVTIALSLLLLRLLPAFRARPLSTVLLPIAVPLLSAALVAFVPAAAPRPTVAIAVALLRRSRGLRRARFDRGRRRIGRLALQPAEQLADDGCIAAGCDRRRFG